MLVGRTRRRSFSRKKLTPRQESMLRDAESLRIQSQVQIGGLGVYFQRKYFDMPDLEECLAIFQAAVGKRKRADEIEADAFAVRRDPAKSAKAKRKAKK